MKICELHFGNDIEIAPKNTYLNLRRKKQFAMLNPAIRTRFEININLKGQEPKGKLEAEKPNSMCSHKIKLADLLDIDGEVLEWIKAAYENRIKETATVVSWPWLVSSPNPKGS